MAKMKTKSAAKKRFKITGSGAIKRSQAFKRHILTKKSTSLKRKLRKNVLLNPSEVKSIKKLLPYA